MDLTNSDGPRPMHKSERWHEHRKCSGSHTPPRPQNLRGRLLAFWKPDNHHVLFRSRFCHAAGLLGVSPSWALNLALSTRTHPSSSFGRSSSRRLASLEARGSAAPSTASHLCHPMVVRAKNLSNASPNPSDVGIGLNETLRAHSFSL
jgi:hypothetical protein